VPGVKTLNYPRRALRPSEQRDDLPDGCAWCGRPILGGEVFTVGSDLGRRAGVCSGCLKPPAMGERPIELTDGEGF
jgi:hypothetical protein